MIDDSLEQFADRHVSRSLDELRDKSKLDRWHNGERAREQAEHIVSFIVASFVNELDRQGGSNAS